MKNKEVTSCSPPPTDSQPATTCHKISEWDSVLSASCRSRNSKPTDFTLQGDTAALSGCKVLAASLMRGVILATLQLANAAANAWWTNLAPNCRIGQPGSQQLQQPTLHAGRRWSMLQPMRGWPGGSLVCGFRPFA
eukprot:352193-Chlamydomonas_euryale.AAC.5